MNTTAALAQLAAFGLPGVDVRPIRLSSHDELLAAAELRRAVPWVAAAVAADRVNGVDDNWRGRLHQRHLVAVQTTMAAHAAAANTVERLVLAGFEVRVLKGVATGFADYERAVDRFSSDVDLLVRSDDLLGVLDALGADESPTPRRPGWDERYGKAITVASATGVELDVHSTLAQGYFGLAIAADELFTQFDEIRIGDTTAARTLDGPGRLIHAAVHRAASPRSGLHSVRDIPQLVLVGGVDWQEAVERTERWGIDALFARGIRQAWGSFPLESHPLVEWATAMQATGRQRLALRYSVRSGAGQFLTGPLALPVRRWPGYMYPIVWPSPAYLQAHGKSRSQRLRLLLPGLRSR